MDLSFIDRALGSGIPYITYAVPVFFLLIFVELLVGQFLRRKLYRLNDMINDLSCGVIEQVVGIFLKGILFGGYLWVYALATERGWNLIDVKTYSTAGKWGAALLLFLGVDCAYYWFHRIAHELNAPWAGHVVHHSSEEYNLAVALRQGTFQGCFSWVFYLPLAFLGFEPRWYAAMSSFDTLYQFWIHTRVIGKLGPLEWVMNTPSHHRVHHARNPQYLDKNYAGTLIIWDRMFGTFIEEHDEPVYGLTKPLNSWNPVWANLHVWADLFRDAWLAPRWIDKLKIWVMPQGWRPQGLPANPAAPRVTRDRVLPFDAHVRGGMNVYVLVQFAVTLAIGVWLMATARATPHSKMVLPAIFVIWSLTTFGAIFEHRRWTLLSEPIRLTILMLGIALRTFDTDWWPAATSLTGGFALASVIWLFTLRSQLDNSPQLPSRIVPDSDSQARADGPPTPQRVMAAEAAAS